MAFIRKTLFVTVAFLSTGAHASCKAPGDIILCCENFTDCNTYPSPIGILEAFDAPTPYLQECGVECVRKFIL
jgi:hypothetical protein